MTTEQANDGGFNFDQLIEAFLHRQGGVCEAHKIVGLCPEVRNLLSGRRLVPFLKGFPEKYRLEQAQPEIMAVRVLTEKAAVEPAEVTRILSGLFGRCIQPARQNSEGSRPSAAISQGRRRPLSRRKIGR
ncbi:hypothetical protein DIPPA_32674 [Diplonema papillatum]|nr:hypothetical protein DIPPA_32674 [Diplonema papillatum]